MDKVNFTTNEVATEDDFNNIGLFNEEGTRNVIKAISCTTTGDVLFKNFFPSTTLVQIAPNITVTATWLQAMGVGVKGIPGLLAATTINALFTQPAVGSSYTVDVRITRQIADQIENRVEMLPDGTRSTIPHVVGKISTIGAEIVLSSAAPSYDYIVWQRLTVTNTAGVVTITSTANQTVLLYHLL